MSKKRYIDTNFWSDNYIADLNRDEKYFFLYLLTNERSSIAGVYEVPLKTIAFETELSKQEVLQMFVKMKTKITYMNGWVVMRNGIKNQNYSNKFIHTGIQTILDNCPQELLEFVDFPKDFDLKTDLMSQKNKQQRLELDSSTSPKDSTRTPEVFNVIKSNLIKSKQPQESNKFDPKSQTPEQKKSYKKAMDIEREQEDRKKKAFERKPSKPVPISNLKEIDAAYERRTHKS